MEKNEFVYIPFMGDDSVSNTTSPDQVADWVREQDKIPLLLALSLYSEARKELGDFVLVPNSYKTRFAVWFNPRDGTAVVGLRGMFSHSDKVTILKRFLLRFASLTRRNLCFIKVWRTRYC